MDDMIAHASKAIPDEAVGLLGGTDQQVHVCIPLLNVASGRTFLVDPYAQYQALRRIRADGLQPLAVYHSHPAGGVLPSDNDLKFASRLPYVQLIIAIGRPHNPAVEVGAYVMPTLFAMHEVTLDVTPE